VAVQRALVSVYDKSGVTEFVRQLAARGIEIVFTGSSGNCLVDTVN
jgi:phosphoribosylaminoimidazolecarboxamide formyltransferase/IMP cyclohydrolase